MLLSECAEESHIEESLKLLKYDSHQKSEVELSVLALSHNVNRLQYYKVNDIEKVDHLERHRVDDSLLLLDIETVLEHHEGLQEDANYRENHYLLAQRLHFRTYLKVVGIEEAHDRVGEQEEIIEEEDKYRDGCEDEEVKDLVWIAKIIVALAQSVHVDHHLRDQAEHLDSDGSIHIYFPLQFLREETLQHDEGYAFEVGANEQGPAEVLSDDVLLYVVLVNAEPDEHPRLHLFYL